MWPLERYRSGHTGTDSKSVGANAHVASNPTLSANTCAKLREYKEYISLRWVLCPTFCPTRVKSESPVMRRRKDSYVGLTARAKWAAAQKGDRVSASNSAPVVIASTSDEGVETASLQAAVARMPRQTPAASQLPPLHLRFQPAGRPLRLGSSPAARARTKAARVYRAVRGLLLAAVLFFFFFLLFVLFVLVVCRRFFVL